MAHHKIGDVGDGKLGAWGFPEGGMGAVTQALRDAAESFGATVRTEVDVDPHPRARRRGARRGHSSTGEEIDADVVIAATHPQITFLQPARRRPTCPTTSSTTSAAGRRRSGTVKVNLAIDRLPEFTAAPGLRPRRPRRHDRARPDRSTTWRTRSRTRSPAGPPTLPFADICIPSVFDRTLAPEGKHVMSMFTQWVPHEWSTDAAPRRARRVRRPRHRPGRGGRARASRDSILHRQVIGPYDMEHTYGLVGGNIFHGELSPAQLFHMRPAPGYADYRTPIRNLYQASSATHGGGGVTGIPGLKVVEQIRHDRKDRPASPASATASRRPPLIAVRREPDARTEAVGSGGGGEGGGDDVEAAVDLGLARPRAAA